MSYYYARRMDQVCGCQDNSVSTAFALCSHALQAQKEDYGESTEGGWRTLSDSQGRERGKKLCAIRTNKDRTGTFEPPCKGHAECGRRQHDAKLTKNKHPP
jgi:hypothetical protein